MIQNRFLLPNGSSSVISLLFPILELLKEIFFCLIILTLALYTCPNTNSLWSWPVLCGLTQSSEVQIMRLTTIVKFASIVERLCWEIVSCVSSTVQHIQLRDKRLEVSVFGAEQDMLQGDFLSLWKNPKTLWACKWPWNLRGLPGSNFLLFRQAQSLMWW